MLPSLVPDASRAVLRREAVTAAGAANTQWLPLHYGTAQTVVAIVFVVLALGLAGLFAVIALQTRRDVPFEIVREHGYRMRRYWLGALAVLGVILIVGSMFLMPYSKHSGPTALVTVTAGQFYWSAVPDHVPADTTVRFDVTSSDVNHGLGVYDPGGVLVGEVQAMPGYHNRLDLTLKRSGTYILACLELCGVGHAHMLRTFKVT